MLDFFHYYRLFLSIKFNFLNQPFDANLIKDKNLKILSIKIYDPFKYILFFSKSSFQFCDTSNQIPFLYIYTKKKGHFRNITDVNKESVTRANK